MFNGTLRMGSGGNAQQTNSLSTLSGEFAGLHTRNAAGLLATDSGCGIHISHSVGSREGGSVGGGRSGPDAGSGVEAPPAGVEPAGGPSGSLALAGGLSGCDDEGCDGGEEKREESGGAAWHSLEATPLIDTATGKKVSGGIGVDAAGDQIGMGACLMIRRRACSVSLNKVEQIRKGIWK